MGAYAAFSLVEILAVLALITLVAGIAVASFGRIVIAAESKPWETRFREAVREARIEAAGTGDTVLLGFDPERGEFTLQVRDQPGSTDDAMDLVFDTGHGHGRDRSVPDIAFHPMLAPESGGGSMHERFSAGRIPHLVFHPSGVSTPARIVFSYADGHASRLTLDPFSFGPLPDRPRHR